MLSPAPIYPADAWGIPWLRADVQPTSLALPIIPWGSVARSTRHGGTWCFYCDDFRFGDWRRLAGKIMASQPSGITEVNFSHFYESARAEVLWGIYRRRLISRTLQDVGIAPWVDLCIPHEFADLTLLGVPKGWRAYCTRGFDARAEETRQEYAMAVEHAGCEPLMLVYGGGRRVAAIAAELRCLYVPARVSEIATAKRPYVKRQDAQQGMLPAVTATPLSPEFHLTT